MKVRVRCRPHGGTFELSAGNRVTDENQVRVPDGRALGGTPGLVLARPCACGYCAPVPTGLAKWNEFHARES